MIWTYSTACAAGLGAAAAGGTALGAAGSVHDVGCWLVVRVVKFVEVWIGVDLWWGR